MNFDLQTYHLKNKATGDTKVMTDKEYLKTNIWKDNNWVIVGNPESRLVKKGFTPTDTRPDHRKTRSGMITPKNLLSSPYYSLFIVVDELDKTNVEALNSINAICVNLTQNYNIRTVFTNFKSS